MATTKSSKSSSLQILEVVRASMQALNACAGAERAGVARFCSGRVMCAGAQVSGVLLQSKTPLLRRCAS
jgi:hypothetical protein